MENVLLFGVPAVLNAGCITLLGEAVKAGRAGELRWLGVFLLLLALILVPTVVVDVLLYILFFGHLNLC